MTECFPLANPQSISKEAKAVSAKFRSADAQKRRLSNLHGHRPRGNGDKWQPCTRLGPPCNNRITASIESTYSQGKDALVYCAEAGCTLEVKVKA